VALGLHFTSTETSLCPIGELDLANVSEFQAALLGFAGRGAARRVVALDLSDLSFVDATGLVVIIVFERQLRDEERVLVLRHPRPMVKRVLDVTGLTWLLEAQGRAPLHIDAAAPRDEFGTESSPSVPLRRGPAMQLSIQSILLNVGDLERSIAFYTEVFEFSVDAQEIDVAALKVSASDRRQVLVLRATKGAFTPAAASSDRGSSPSRRDHSTRSISSKPVLTRGKLSPDDAARRARRRSLDSTRTAIRSPLRPAFRASRSAKTTGRCSTRPSAWSLNE
jgi:anti-anti-sigma factor